MRSTLNILAILTLLSLLSCQSAQATEKEILLPADQQDQDYNDPNSEFCYPRSVQGDNVIIFWSKEHGNDPSRHTDPNKTFDVNDMLSECERYYKTYVDNMKLVVKGQSVSDKYKLIAYVVGGDEGTAYGGGDGDVATLHTPAMRVHKPPYGVLAHEMVHCFQHLSRTDGARGGGVNPEMAAQHGLWQNLPEWLTFENYHLVAFMDQTHLKFDHFSNMYHTAQVMEYWAYLHGQDFYGQMLRSPEEGDVVTVYKKQFNRTQEQFNNEMFDAYRRFMTWDIPRIDEVARPYANQHHTKLDKLDNGWYQIAAEKCPENYGYNGIKLDVPAAGTNVVLNFKGIAGAEGFSPTKIDKAGWRYGFVASLKDGSRVYGNVGTNPQDALAFQVPENTEYLWLVVMGAPTEHWASFGGWGRRGRSNNQEPEAQWPYQFKLTGTAPDEAMIQ